MQRKISILAIIIPLFLNAENAEMDDIFSFDLEDLQNITISSASKMDQSLRDVPANMLVFTKDQISKRGFRSVSDLLSTLPGVMINNFATSGYFNSISIRGITGAHYFKILLDGVEIDQTNGEYISTAMNFSLHGIERAEVLYGPASVIYGADAVSGIINLITKKNDGGEFFFSAAQDEYYNTNIRYAQQLGEYKLIVRTHLHNDQKYRFDELYPENFPYVDIVDSSSNIIEAAQNRKFDFTPSNTKSLNVLLKHEDFDIGLNYSYTEDSTLLGQIDKKSYQNVFDDNSNIMVSLFGVYGKYYSSYDDVSFTSTLSYDSTTVEEGSYFINDHTDYKKAYKYSKSEHISLEETAKVELGKHQMVAGINLEYYESMPMSFDMPSESISSSYLYPGSNIPINYYEKSWYNYSLFAQDYYTYSDELKFSLAVRYDYNTMEGNIFNPRLAVIYQPTSKTTHKLIYSESFLSPSMESKYKHYGNAFETNVQVGDTNTYQTPYFMVPNEDLEAEASRTLEYSFYSQFENHLILNASAYYTKLDNLITERSVSNVTDVINDVTVLYGPQNYNSGYAIMQGFDISLNYKNSIFGINTEPWINYSYIDGYIYEQSKQELPFIAPHQVNTGVVLSQNKWSISPSLKWINHINSGLMSDDNTKREYIAGYTIVDIFGIYKFKEDVVGSLSISNLTDKRYYNARSSFGSSYITPQLGRTIILGFKVEF